jgi:uncharacterized membrane protein
MKPDEFIAQLRRHLRALPPEEIDQSVAYYEEYLADAEDPSLAIAELGSPAEVAAQILGEYVSTPAPPTAPRAKKRGLPMLWAVILGVFALPIAAPLAIAVAAIAITLMVSLLAIVVALLVTALSLVLGGIAFIAWGLMVATQDISTCLSLAGVGLMGIGIGLLGGFAVIRLSNVLIHWLTRLVGRFLVSRSAK